MIKSIYNKNLLLLFVVTIISLSFCCVNIVEAKDNKSEYVLTECTTSEAYVKWSKLSKEEKSNTLMPDICDYDKSIINPLKANIDEQFSVFNATYPSSYDPRGTDNQATMRDQQNTGQCWAFATVEQLEIYGTKYFNKRTVYSARHMEYATSRVFLNNEINPIGFNRTVGTGGHVIFASAYLTSQNGPVLESEMPFENNEATIELSKIQNKSETVDVNSIMIETSEYSPCTSAQISSIKNEVTQGGSAVTSIYMDISSDYYNPVTGAFYYNGVSYPNHAVLIVGWDDNYSANNFGTNKPSSNGAFLVQNSYGDVFGQSGYFYVSYEDERVCSVFMGLRDVDEDIEDNKYIYDTLGYNVGTGYRDSTTGLISNKGYGLNVFTKSNKDEILKEITIGTLGKGKYKIYYWEGNGSAIRIDGYTLIGEGTTDYRGYYTHKLESPIAIGASVEKFSIAVYWELDNLTTPIPALRNTYADYMYHETLAGTSYMSPDGQGWGDVAGNGYVVSIKAFTDNVDYSLSATNSMVSEGASDNIVLNLTLSSKNISKDKLSYEIKSSKGIAVTAYNVSYTESSGVITGATFDFYNGLDNGDYVVSIYYDGTLVETIGFNVAFGMVSSVYTISKLEKTIYVERVTTVSSFLGNISGSSGEVFNGATEITTGNIGTGMTLDGYVIILKGDVTGDGYIRMNDVMKISTYLVEGVGLQEKYYKLAADVTQDSNIRMNDVMKISTYLVEGGTL